MKDWLKNDPGVPVSIRRTVEQEIKNFESLLICADLANRSKHLVLDRNIKRDADIGGRKIVAVVNETIGTPESSVTVSWDYVVTLGDGSTRNALELADDAIAAWERLLLKYGLAP